MTDTQDKIAEKTTSPQSKKQNTLIRYAILFGIVILINLFVSYAIQVVYPQPEYDQFCPIEKVNVTYPTQEECVSNGGQWNAPAGLDESGQNAYCNTNFTCNQQFEDASSLYNRNVFVVFVVVGLALLVGSLFVPGSSLIASAFSLAGILALIIGSLTYWSNMNDILRLVILGIALATVLYFAWKKFED